MIEEGFSDENDYLDYLSEKASNSGYISSFDADDSLFYEPQGYNRTRDIIEDYAEDINLDNDFIVSKDIQNEVYAIIMKINDLYLSDFRRFKTGRKELFDKINDIGISISDLESRLRLSCIKDAIILMFRRMTGSIPKEYALYDILNKWAKDNSKEYDSIYASYKKWKNNREELKKWAANENNLTYLEAYRPKNGVFPKHALTYALRSSSIFVTLPDYIIEHLPTVYAEVFNHRTLYDYSDNSIKNYAWQYLSNRSEIDLSDVQAYVLKLDPNDIYIQKEDNSFNPEDDDIEEKVDIYEEVFNIWRDEHVELWDKWYSNVKLKFNNKEQDELLLSEYVDSRYNSYLKSFCESRVPCLIPVHYYPDNVFQYFQKNGIGYDGFLVAEEDIKNDEVDVNRYKNYPETFIHFYTKRIDLAKTYDEKSYLMGFNHLDDLTFDLDSIYEYDYFEEPLLCLDDEDFKADLLSEHHTSSWVEGYIDRLLIEREFRSRSERQKRSPIFPKHESQIYGLTLWGSKRLKLSFDDIDCERYKPTDEAILKLNPKELFIEKGLVSDYDKQKYLSVKHQLMAFEKWKAEYPQEWAQWARRKLVNWKGLWNTVVEEEDYFNYWISDVGNAEQWNDWLKNDFPLYKKIIELINVFDFGLDTLDYNHFNTWAQFNIPEWNELLSETRKSLLNDNKYQKYLAQIERGPLTDDLLKKEQLLWFLTENDNNFSMYSFYV